jgi:hypothetical protein
MVQLSATRCSYIAFCVSLVSFATITLCVAFQQVFLVVDFIMTQSRNFWLCPRISSVSFVFKLMASEIEYLKNLYKAPLCVCVCVRARARTRARVCVSCSSFFFLFLSPD